MKVIGFVAACCLLLGCYYDVESELYGGGCDHPQVISFSQDVMPLISSNCALSGCHVTGGGAPNTLESYADIKAIVDTGNLTERVIKQQNMPPSGPLSICNLSLLEKWIADGAPEN